MNNSTRPKPTPEILQLEEELALVRKQSLEAIRIGDYMRVARLTNHAASINQQIFNIRTQLGELRARVYDI